MFSDQWHEIFCAKANEKQMIDIETGSILRALDTPLRNWMRAMALIFPWIQDFPGLGFWEGWTNERESS